MPADPTKSTTKTRGDRIRRWTNAAIDTTIATGVVLLILIGFASSYRTLRDLATTIGGYPPWLAPAVPLSFDLGIVVLSLKVIRQARDGQAAPLLRLQVAALSIATVAVNASIASSPVARLLHAVPPAMFVICFENVVGTARSQALHRLGIQPSPLPPIAWARWVLAPWSSARAWREGVLATSDAETPAPDPSEPPSPRRPRPRSARVPGRNARLDIARRELEHEPQLTAERLAEKLAQNGHPVSVRTAQRIRASVSANER